MDFWSKLLTEHTGVTASSRQHKPQTRRRLCWHVSILSLVAMMMTGCGFLSGPEEPTPTATIQAQLQLMPTWTPTPIEEPTATPALPAATPEAPVALPTVAASTAEEATAGEEVTEEPVAEEATAEEEVASTAAPTDTPAPTTARLTVTGNVINVRQGPGTDYGVIGSVNNGMSFDVLGKNPAGDWYQFCCVNGEQGWIYGPLVQVENAQLVAVAQNIPAAPPTNTPAPVAVAPPADTPVPQPQPEPQPEPQPQPESDPCANIGGDGCKFKVTGGPNFGNNGGTELKLNLFFIHSGVDGGQPQGSYFIHLEKDGQQIPVPDSIRSVALQRSEGGLGPYNYEYKIGSSSLPGGNVAGNYTGWVLDGNGERDSRNFSFTVPDGQGEVWLQLDQN